MEQRNSQLSQVSDEALDAVTGGGLLDVLFGNQPLLGNVNVLGSQNNSQQNQSSGLLGGKGLLGLGILGIL